MRRGRLFIFFLFALLLESAYSCGSRKQVQQSEVRDSVKVTVSERVEFRTDTVRIALPAVSQERDTEDTMSVLRNAYGESRASISGGRLHHTLQLYGGTHDTIVRIPVYYRDSIQEHRSAARSIETTLTERKFPFPAWSFLLLASALTFLYFKRKP